MAQTSSASLPESIQPLLHGAIWHQVLLGESGTEVFRLEYPDGEARYMKVLNREQSHEANLKPEHDRLLWLSGRLPAPRVLAYCPENEREYLLLSAVPGIPVCEDGHGLSRELRVRLMAQALRQIHSLSISDCPFDESPVSKISRAETHLEAGLVKADLVSPYRPGKTLLQILDDLKASVPAPKTLSFAHGDYCEPNILLSNGQVSGFVDWGQAGIADPAYDLCIAAESLKRNGNGHLWPFFLAEYGAAEPSQEIVEFYRLVDAFLS